MAARPATPGSPSWERLLQDVAACPDPDEALQRLVAAAAELCGAAAGAVVQLPGRDCRGAWGCRAEDVRELVAEGGALGDRIAAQHEWRDAPIWLHTGWPAAASLTEYEHALLVALHVREVLSGALLLFFDATRRRPEREVEDAVGGVAALAALVVENDRLYEDARQARQLRDDFLTAINHELRTPATAFVLDAFMLRSGMYGALSPALDRHLGQIESHLEIITRVLDGVLSLGNGPGTIPDFGEVFQPRQVVLNLLRRIEPAAKRKNLPILLYAPRTLPMIQLDVATFSRVLLHVLSNAVKYTNEGRIEVRLEQAARSAGHQRRERVLVVRVRDTGCGIPEAHLARIFEPFAQVDEGARTDSRSRGLGLGLSIANALAHSLQGELTIESTVGEGTTVSFVVPYHH